MYGERDTVVFMKLENIWKEYIIRKEVTLNKSQIVRQFSEKGKMQKIAVISFFLMGSTFAVPIPEVKDPDNQG